MEPELVVGVSLFLAALFVLLGLWQRRIARLERKSVVAEIQDSHQRGTQQALTQHPQINRLKCIGCGSCVAACPEHNALRIVDGVAHVIHGSRCIGHGRCEDACPVAALTVGLGDVSSRPDIPVLTEDLETSLPGVYIAGELGGVSLIRNAIEQGVRAVEAIARRSRSRPGARPVPVDVLIVGAGPAGIAATLKATECKLTYAAIDQDDVGGTVRKYPRRKLTMTQPVSLPLYGRMKRHEYVKEELIDLWDSIVRDFALKIQSGVKLVGLTRHADCLVAQTTAGQVRARNVVLALGRRGTPRRLGVPGEESEKVLYQLIDAATYRDQHALVVGGGDSAVEAAMALANQPGNEVTLSYRKPNFFRLKQRNEERIRDYIERQRIHAIFSSGVERIEPESVTITSKKDGLEYRKRLKNDYVFVFAGGEPPYPLLKAMGVEFGGETKDSPRSELAKTAS